MNIYLKAIHKSAENIFPIISFKISSDNKHQ